MKRFRFALDTVLGYKQQRLDSLQAEHAALVQAEMLQERRIQELADRHAAWNKEFRAAEKEGITIAEARRYEMGLRVLERQIDAEEKKLAALREAVEKKRLQVVAARQETASLEHLRAQKFEAYQKDVQKNEEQFIDELVSASRVMAAGRR